MKTTICIAVLFVLAGYDALAAEPDAVKLSRQLILRENERLTTSIQSSKVFMAITRMTSAHASMYHHSVARMESIIASHNLILKQGRADLLVMSARAVVHGDLERHYAAQEEMRQTHNKTEVREPKKAIEQGKMLLAELKVLKAWRNKALKK
jgi:hypothetical protein